MKILNEEPIYEKRLSEMIFIKKQKNSLNLQSDTENLHAYLTLVENLSKVSSGARCLRLCKKMLVDLVFVLLHTVNVMRSSLKYFRSNN